MNIRGSSCLILELFIFLGVKEKSNKQWARWYSYMFLLVRPLNIIILFRIITEFKNKESLKRPILIIMKRYILFVLFRVVCKNNQILQNIKIQVYYRINLYYKNYQFRLFRSKFKHLIIFNCFYKYIKHYKKLKIFINKSIFI